LPKKVDPMTHDSITHRLSRVAPFITAGVLVALIATGGVDAHRHSGIEAYMADVRAAIDAVPHNIGGAVGSDVEPPPAAVRILSPNRILQRRFLDPLTGEGMSVLVVHCGDVRDMLGHYPPVCYPAHGWISGPQRSIPIEIAGTQAVAVVYEFSRTDDLVERRMTVVNLFVVPGSGPQFAPDMSAVERSARTQAAAGLGVAQFQIVLDGAPSHEEQMSRIRAVVPVLEPIARAIGRGVER
jgi:hypothetical protein